MHERIRWPAGPEITGPMSVSVSAPLPTRRVSERRISSGPSRDQASPTVTTTEPAMHRWPAAPKALEMMFSAVLAMIASGITTMWFLAPPSACTRLPVAEARV